MKTLLLLAVFYTPFVMQAQTKAKTAAPPPATTTPAPYQGPKGCPNAMTDEEFNSVKKTISSESDVDNVIVIAKKEASTHCYSVEQVKTIMKSLKTDDNKFEFFKAVYPHIYDQNRYTQLNTSFTDKSYSDKIRVYVNSLE
jgi:hypothetical protein